jgi:hypothetical protein
MSESSLRTLIITPRDRNVSLGATVSLVQLAMQTIPGLRIIQTDDSSKTVVVEVPDDLASQVWARLGDGFDVNPPATLPS